MQCQTSTGLCWCTLDDGRAILDTVVKPGSPISREQCESYQLSACDAEVADVVAKNHPNYLSIHGVRQVVEQRSFYEDQPLLFVPRCRRDLSRSYQAEQYTWRGRPENSEFFCVSEADGKEVAGSRLGPGEHRFVDDEKKRCPFRPSHCQREVFDVLRSAQKSLRSTDFAASLTVNREEYRGDAFLPDCQDRVGDHYGYRARQCGQTNRTCWCVYADGVAVGGTEHESLTMVDCSPCKYVDRNCIMLERGGGGRI